jgi:hypothetical protein
LAHLYYEYNIPEEFRNHELMYEILEQIKVDYKKASDKKNSRERLESCMKYSMKITLFKSKNNIDRKYKVPERLADEQRSKELEEQRQQQIQQQKEEMFTNIKEKKETNKKIGEYTYEVQGTISIDGQKYNFIFNNSHENPCLFGCFNEETIEKAKKEINKRFSITRSFVSDKDQNKFGDIQEHKAIKTIMDTEDKIFVYKADEHTFKGYIEGYAFVWNTNEEVPCGTPVKNALLNNYRKMNSSWGNGFVKRAQMIKDFCMNNFQECFNVTKEIITIDPNEEIDEDEL